jgi:hypothetical protein
VTPGDVIAVRSHSPVRPAAELDGRLDALAKRLPAPASTHPLDELKTLAGLGGPLCLPFDESSQRIAERRLELVRAA